MAVDGIAVPRARVNALKIAVETELEPAVSQLLEDAINAFNMAVTSDTQYTPVNVLLRDEQDRVQGGAVGGIWGEWLYLKYFWVAEALRGQGYGSQLLALFETEAQRGKCRGIYLETYSFQAYSFYRRRGFETRGSISDFPPGHTFYLLAKPLFYA